MWDGFWFLANAKAWNGIPENLRAIISKNLNEAGKKQREDIFALNTTLEKELSGKGLVFNEVNQAPFRDKLSSAGFYKEWKGKYGDEAWALLEKYAGKIS